MGDHRVAQIMAFWHPEYGKKWRQREEMEGKISLIFDKNTFFCGNLFGEPTLSKDIILGGCHTINFALGDPCNTLYIEVEKMRQE